jgi:hypothetical protein
VSESFIARGAASPDALLESVTKFSSFLFTESFNRRAESTVMVFFTSILGISTDGSTFERPLNYTLKLSALVYYVRLCLLESTLPRFAYVRNCWKPRPRAGLDTLLNKVRDAHFCYGSATPVGELLSLRAYGRAVSRSDGPTFRVDWSDDSETLN